MLKEVLPELTSKQSRRGFIKSSSVAVGAGSLGSLVLPQGAHADGDGTERLGPETYEWSDMPEPKIAIPGRTKFV